MNGHGPTNSYSLPGGSDGKESGCNAGDPGLIPGSVRSHGEGNGYPLRYSCLEKSMDRGPCWSTVHGSQRVRQYSLRVRNTKQLTLSWGFPGGARAKNPSANAGSINDRDVGSIPRSGRSPGGGHNNPLQYSCLESPMDRGTWWGSP